MFGARGGGVFGVWGGGGVFSIYCGSGVTSILWTSTRGRGRALWRTGGRYLWCIDWNK